MWSSHSHKEQLGQAYRQDLCIVSHSTLAPPWELLEVWLLPPFAISKYLQDHCIVFVFFLHISQTLRTNYLWWNPRYANELQHLGHDETLLIHQYMVGWFAHHNPINEWGLSWFAITKFQQGRFSKITTLISKNKSWSSLQTTMQNLVNLQPPNLGMKNLNNKFLIIISRMDIKVVAQLQNYTKNQWAYAQVSLKFGEWQLFKDISIR